MQQLVEWQRIDPDNGLVFPWWTWPFMDMLKMGDYSRLSWLEFGAGLGTAWLRSKCQWVDSIEANREWADKAHSLCHLSKLYNGNIFRNPDRDIPDGIPEEIEGYFDIIPKDVKYDVISVDGIYRYEAVRWAIDHFKGRTGLLIVDNLDQDFVWISPATMELLKPYHCEVFYQPGHVVHEGKPWNTRLYIIQK